MASFASNKWLESGRKAQNSALLVFPNQRIDSPNHDFKTLNKILEADLESNKTWRAKVQSLRHMALLSHLMKTKASVEKRGDFEWFRRKICRSDAQKFMVKLYVIVWINKQAVLQSD